MATSIVNVADTAYSLLTSTNALIQNTSSYRVKVVFAASLPAANAKGHSLDSGQAISITSGVPADNAYGICVDKGRTADIAVSE